MLMFFDKKFLAISIKYSLNHRDLAPYYYYYLFIYFFLGLYPRHMEISGPGAESELQLPAYTTATAT